MAKVTRTGTVGSYTYTEEETTLIDTAVMAVTLPLSIMDTDGNDFISKKDAAYAAGGWFLGGYALGARKPYAIPVVGLKS